MFLSESQEIDDTILSLVQNFEPTTHNSKKEKENLNTLKEKLSRIFSQRQLGVIQTAQSSHSNSISQDLMQKMKAHYVNHEVPE